MAISVNMINSICKYIEQQKKGHLLGKGNIMKHTTGKKKKENPYVS